MEEILLWQQKYMHYLELERELSRHSLRAIQKDLQYFVEYLSQENFREELSRYYLKGYVFHLQNQEYSLRTIQRKMSSLKGFLRFLREKNFQKEDFSLYLLDWKREEDSLCFFELEEWKNFRKAFQENLRDRAIFELLYSTGLTPKAFLSLTYLQIHWEKQEIYLFEKGKTRIVFFSQRAKAALCEYCQQEKIQEGNLWNFSEKTLRNILKKYRENGVIGETITIYSFRHSFAIHLLDAGMPTEEVQYLLGLNHGESLLRYDSYLKKGR